MARILFVLPLGLDMGGILTSSEMVVAGLKAAGHEVNFYTADFGLSDRGCGTMPRGKYADAFVYSPYTDALFHPMLGWRNEPRFNLNTDYGIERFLKATKHYDITIWGCVFPFLNDGHAGWLPAVAKNRSKQLFLIHDDHLVDRYPWALALAKYGAFVGMFQAAYDSLATVASDRALIYNPVAPLPRVVTPYDKRRGFISMQVWKPWKNADKLVAAAPLMAKDSVSFAGDGIQLRYMRSLDKCPPKFAGMWDAAMKKQRYLGVLDADSRDNHLSMARYLVDLSIRPNNTGQINTMVQQAMAQGCVVIANPDFLGSSPFEPWKHYLPINTCDYGPEALRFALLNLERDLNAMAYGKMQAAARATLRGLFERAHIGQCFVDFALRSETGKPTAEQNKKFQATFGVRP